MGYEFECTNVFPGCEGKVEGATKDDVLAAAAAHAADAHGVTELPDDVAAVVQASIVPSS